ncbi:MAG TPA: indole-3-glycerol phosphate synthase TrpC [Dehalococcoidia bacterium]|jgi:indole-3-glycerol phosphate synthase|nr:indole-3-glycerol phosphate synthase TrpC [Dehalococcoidia bacterium]
MPSILDKIVADKREELARQKELVSLSNLESRISSQQIPLDLSRALRGPGVQLIAEVKKASPSRGLLCADFDPVRIAGAYASNGAAAISILTDTRFEGELDHIVQVKQLGVSQGVPVLRKDFIFDLYQVYETRAAGADGLLLIVAILSPQQLKELLELSRRLLMRCLVEVHNDTELQTALDAGAEIIGINNRDLHTFTTDLAVTQRLIPQVPRGKVIVSESGISTRDHLRQLGEMGVNAVLVGEALVTALDIGAKVRELTGQVIPSRNP